MTARPPVSAGRWAGPTAGSDSLDAVVQLHKVSKMTDLFIRRGPSATFNRGQSGAGGVEPGLHQTSGNMHLPEVGWLLKKTTMTLQPPPLEAVNFVQQPVLMSWPWRSDCSMWQ